MAWTYSDSEASAKDQVRGVIGDVNAADPLLSDEKLAALLTANGSHVLLTARAAVKAILTKFARTDVDVRFGPSSVSGSERQRTFRQILADIDRQLAVSGSVFAGGISKASKEVYRDTSDRVLPAFTAATHAHSGGDDRLSDFPDD